VDATTQKLVEFATRCCRINATLKNGQTVVAEHRRSLADDERDTGWEQAVEKFTQLTGERLSIDTSRRILDVTEHLDAEPALQRWIGLLQL
jgi:hypothetical protein